MHRGITRPARSGIARRAESGGKTAEKELLNLNQTNLGPRITERYRIFFADGLWSGENGRHEPRRTLTRNVVPLFVLVFDSRQSKVELERLIMITTMQKECKQSFIGFTPYGD
jgi:hypothetical protein